MLIVVDAVVRAEAQADVTSLSDVNLSHDEWQMSGVHCVHGEVFSHPLFL